MSTPLIALCTVTFALGIAAGNGPRLITAARGAAQAWQPRRAPAPFTHQMEGTTIMSADNFPANRPDNDDEHGPGRRGRRPRHLDPGRPARQPRPDGPRPVEAVPTTPPTTTAPTMTTADHESVLVGRVVTGPAVDPPDEPRPCGPAAAAPARRSSRRPGVPRRAGRVAAVGGQGGPVSRRASTRCAPPKYAVKTVRVRRARRAADRRRGWPGGQSAEDGNWHLRQAAAGRGDAGQWLALDARRQRQARWRWPVLLAGAVVLPGPRSLLARAAAGAGGCGGGWPSGRWWRWRRGRAARRTSRSPTG